GGAAVCFSGATYVNQEGKGFPSQLASHDDYIVPGLKELAEAVEAAGAPLAVQIFHAGRTALSAVTGMPIAGPSPIKHPKNDELPRELSTQEVKDTVRAFGESARRVREAGVKMLEIHGATWYLIQQFFSSSSNKRTDEYGGSLERRMRFPVEVARAVRENAGEDMVISYRTGLLEPWEEGFTIEDTLALAAALEEAGMDIIHCSRNARNGVAVEPEFYNPAFDRLRKKVKLALIANGRSFEPSRVQEYLDMGADLVAVGRAMLTDPDYAGKALAGRDEEILTCIQCRPCIYMRDSRCPDDAYPGGEPDGIKPSLEAASKMKTGGYAPTEKKRVNLDDPVDEAPGGSAVSG
ncbi:MAG: NADH:flavin oxidoreductase, partial [Nitrospinaceae bacterium]|nr:NADH:flavin oxidoreductase [Nitrospinaceae bacterium]